MARHIIARPTAARLPGQVFDTVLQQLRRRSRKLARQPPVRRFQYLHRASGVAEMKQNPHQFQIGLHLRPGFGGLRHEGAGRARQRLLHLRFPIHVALLPRYRNGKGEATP
ncbi:hypothetical protein NDN16_15500 [Aureimonas altamirensis]|nr:hypothetical protein [Aureimonas altamirensis]